MGGFWRNLSLSIVLFSALACFNLAWSNDGTQIYPFNRSELLPLNPNARCVSPNQSPDCVARTVTACQLPGARRSDCLKVGFDVPDQPPVTSERDSYTSDIGAEPWRKSWLYLAGGWYDEICNVRSMAVRTVGPDRFSATPPLPPELVGTHEILVFRAACPPLEAIFVQSIFLRETTQGWQAVSLTTNVLQDDPRHPVPENFFSKCNDPLCSYRANGLAKPEVPLESDYPSRGMGPVFTKDGDFQCAVKWRDTPLCKPDL